MHFALSFFFDLYYDSKWKGAEFMARYQCMYCEEIYDEELGEPYKGIAPGTRFEDLPENCQKYVRFIEEYCGTKIALVSVNPEREGNIILSKLI